MDREDKSILINNTEEEMQDLVSGCVNCGLCKGLCPLFKVLKEECLSPRGFVNLMKKKIVTEDFFKCTLCGSCEVRCPKKIKICEAVRKAREILFLRGS